MTPLTDMPWVNWVFGSIFFLGVLYAAYRIVPQVILCWQWLWKLKSKTFDLLFFWRWHQTPKPPTSPPAP
jgi:hypothetical protein